MASKVDAQLSKLEGTFSGEFLGTLVCVGADRRWFTVEVRPFRDVWIDSPVLFSVTLPDSFPKARPQVKCVEISEKVRLDDRLCEAVEVPVPVVVAPGRAVREGKAEGVSESDNSDSDGMYVSEDEAPAAPKELRPRISGDGSVSCNLLCSPFMGWLEIYSLEVVVYTLRLLFRRPEKELAPARVGAPPRAKPCPVFVESSVYEEQGPRKTMEDRVCAEDFRFVPFGGDGVSGGGPSPKFISRRGAHGLPHPRGSSLDRETDSGGEVEGGGEGDDIDINTLAVSAAGSEALAAVVLGGGQRQQAREARHDDQEEQQDGQEPEPRGQQHLQRERQQQLQQDDGDDATGTELSGPSPRGSDFGAGPRARLAMSGSFSGADKASLAYSGEYEEAYGRKLSLHAVLDGHGGYKSADAASLLLEELFFEEALDEGCGVERALYNAITGIEDRLAEGARQEKERTGYIINTSGTTLCAVSIDLDEGVLYCGNVGDSRATLCRAGGRALDLSTDDKATRPDAIAAVVMTGGFVSHGRVLGMLAVSRALGNPEMKTPNPLISALPTMRRVELERDDQFVLIACDGVFDVLSSQDACDFVAAKLAEMDGDVERVTVALVRHVLGPLRSQDNVSAIIIKLGHRVLDHVVGTAPSDNLVAASSPDHAHHHVHRAAHHNERSFDMDATPPHMRPAPITAVPPATPKLALPVPVTSATPKPAPGAPPPRPKLFSLFEKDDPVVPVLSTPVVAASPLKPAGGTTGATALLVPTPVAVKPAAAVPPSAVPGGMPLSGGMVHSRKTSFAFEHLNDDDKGGVSGGASSGNGGRHDHGHGVDSDSETDDLHEAQEGLLGLGLGEGKTVSLPPPPSLDERTGAPTYFSPTVHAAVRASATRLRKSSSSNEPL